MVIYSALSLSRQTLGVIMQTEKNDIEQKNNIEPFFSIRRVDQKEDGEYFYIRANPLGLKKYADSLTRIANDIEQNGELANKKLPHDFWVMGDLTLDYVEIVKEEPNTRLLEPGGIQETSSKTKDIGCVVLIIALIALTIIGIVTVYKWL